MSSSEPTASRPPGAEVLEGLPIEIQDFTADLAYRAAELRGPTKHLGLSLGDRACLALGLSLRSRILTGDRARSAGPLSCAAIDGRGPRTQSRRPIAEGTIHAHPTMSEAVAEAARAAVGQAIHI